MNAITGLAMVQPSKSRHGPVTGYLVERSNLIEKLFKSLHLSLARVPGALAVATIVTCAIFATATGIIGAVVTLMGLLAFPAMLKAGYKTNVIPGTAEAELDVRLLPGEDPQAFLAEMRTVIEDPTIEIIAPSMSTSHGPWKLETRYCGTANATPATRISRTAPRAAKYHRMPDS